MGTPRDDAMPTMRSKVARIDVQFDVAMTSHTANGQYESQGGVPNNATSLDMDGGSNEEEPEDGIPEEAIMDGRRPGIFLIDLPHSDMVPTEYLWRQCAVFMAVMSEIGVSVRCRSTTFLDVSWSVRSVYDLCTMYRGRSVYKPLGAQSAPAY